MAFDSQVYTCSINIQLIQRQRQQNSVPTTRTLGSNPTLCYVWRGETNNNLLVPQRAVEDSHAATRARNDRPVSAITRHASFFKNSHNCNLALLAGVGLTPTKQPIFFFPISPPFVFAAAACTRSGVMITVISQKPQRDTLTNKEAMVLRRSVAPSLHPSYQVGELRVVSVTCCCTNGTLFLI